MAAPTVDELLELAVAQLRDEIPDGQSAAPVLARKIGLPYPRVYKWFKPGNGMDAQGAMAILDTFGWLKIPADAREAAGLPPDPLEELGESVEEILAIVRELRARGESQRRPTAAAPKRSGKKT